jgi:hypothetical protein
MCHPNQRLRSRGRSRRRTPSSPEDTVAHHGSFHDRSGWSASHTAQLSLFFHRAATRTPDARPRRGVATATRRASLATAAPRERNRDRPRPTPTFAEAGAPVPAECDPEWPRDWLLPSPRRALRVICP